jgi:hypothetical protein
MEDDDSYDSPQTTTRLAGDYPFVLELVKTSKVKANQPIPLYVPSIDVSHCANLKRCQKKFNKRCIDPKGSSTPLLQLPTVTMNGSKFDIRTMTDDQIAEFERTRGSVRPGLPEPTTAKSELTEDYPFFLELAVNVPVPTSMPIPAYVPTADYSRSGNFRMCQQHFRGRCIDPNDTDEDALIQLPTILVAGAKYDVRTLTAEQIDLLQTARRTGMAVQEAVFLQAGRSGRMHGRLTMQDMMRQMQQQPM